MGECLPRVQALPRRYTLSFRRCPWPHNADHRSIIVVDRRFARLPCAKPIRQTA